VAFHTEGDVTLPGLALTLLAALSWGTGKLIARMIGQVNALALVVWGSLVAAPFLIVASLVVDGPGAIGAAIEHGSWALVGSVFYICYLSTLFAYSLWSWLLARHPAAIVTPFTLLVPIFGFVGAVIFLGEGLPTWKLVSGALVIAGLCVNLLGKKIPVTLTE
jgi:O-acetylserine/cysteine efflux transporter